MFSWFIIFFGQYLAWIFGALFAILFLLGLKNRERVWIFIEALAAAVFSRFIITEAIRYFYNSPRPFEISNIAPIIPHDIGYSFPSGHAAFFFALGLTIFFYDKRWGTLFLIGAVLMGIARVLAGVHWPSDIIGGAIVAVLSSALTHFIFIKFRKPSL